MKSTENNATLGPLYVGVVGTGEYANTVPIMSSPSIHPDTFPGTEQAHANVLERGAAMVGSHLRTAAFWSAVSLPFLHIPLLLSGLDTMAQTSAFLVLLVLNAAMLVLGHGYEP